MPAAWSRLTKSPSSLAERSPTSCSTPAVRADSIACWSGSMAILLGRGKPRHAVGPDRARKPSIVVQVVQVRDGLAHGKENLAGVELAPEQQLQHVGRGTRRGRAGRLQ